jgi:1,4-alpha-glucan branching enzyme
VTKAAETPAGYLALTLNAHLPYVIHHGTWPHGMEWLHEAVAETYLPLLRVLANLERDHVPANFSINLSPILLEQLAHPLFRVEFPKYVTRKIVAAREDEAYFHYSGDCQLGETARFWGNFYTTTLDDFNALDGEIIRGFRHFNDAGLIEIMTCAATHGYLPLLGTDESVRAQIGAAVQTHVRHFGRAPRGIWSPECGYRPAGLWSYPVLDHGATEPHPAFQRIGIEQALAESGLEYFFVDTHLVEERQRSLYQSYLVDGPDKRFSTTVFPRDPRTGLQVWASDTGYPSDTTCLDFHKRRFPGGHRYWRVPDPSAPSEGDVLYSPWLAAERVQKHASHFVQLVYQTLQSSFGQGTPPILCAPFDADLFGHWWFEGPQWLEAVARALHAQNLKNQSAGVAATTCSQYLDRHPSTESIALSEGSWGSGGNHQVWMNPDTSWTYAHLYPAERFTREVCTAGLWRNSELGLRIVQQLCRELLLLESSDWQSLITTGSARDYAERRFLNHNKDFLELKSIWQAFAANHAATHEGNTASTNGAGQSETSQPSGHDGELNLLQTNRLAEIEQRDHIFPDLDPGLWIGGAQPTATPVSALPELL